MIDKTTYFLDRQGDWYLISKEQLKIIVDPFNEDTFLPHLKNMNYPYFKQVWESIRDRCAQLNEKQLTFGKYLATMNLRGYKYFTWENTNQEE